MYVWVLYMYIVCIYIIYVYMCIIYVYFIYIHTHTQMCDIHSSVNGHPGCFHALAIVNSATMNTGVHMFLWIMVFSDFMPRSEISGLYGSFYL